MLKKAQWKITCRQLEILKIMGRDDTPVVMKEGPIAGDWMKGGSLEGKSRLNGGTEQDAQASAPGMA